MFRAIMFRAIVTLLAMVCVPACAFAADDDVRDEQRTGQYSCYVENSVGITAPDNQPAFGGKINLPDGDKKFLVRITHIQRDPYTKDMCSRSVSALKEALERGADLSAYSTATIYGTRNFGESCLRRFMAEIPKPGSPTWTFFGDGPFLFTGQLPNMSLTLYGTNKFTMVLPYEGDPVLETGKCEKIKAPG
jgi:hypothetical protein